ncbi:MAG: PKD domain-containing protein [Bacteroidales bacterium]|nr:PKD domain-containing protein [Bacteroidales bacterium]
MKKINLTIVLFLIGLGSIFAQIPQAINFQAIARDGDSNPMVNTNIQIQLSILDGTDEGPVIYQELRALQTNAYGSFSFQIGRDANYVTAGSFDEIVWETGNKFLKIDYDPSNTFTFTLTLGTIEFVSVPYAFAAETVVFIDATGAENGDVLVYNEATGKFEPGQASSANIGWDNIENKPDFSTVSTSGDYNDLINLPILFDGDYNNLTNQPILFDGDWSSLNNTPTTIAGYGITDAFTGDYNDLTNTPTLSDDQNLSEVLSESNDGGSNQIKNIANPTDAQDVATKAYVDQLINLFENNGMVVVDFSSDATNITLGNAVIFTDNSVLEATNWQWDFGDGNTSTEQNPTHTYISEGSFTVSLTASNGILSSTKTKIGYVTVTEGLQIGDFANGGIVFYIFQSGDAGYVEGEIHGLVCAESDQSTGAIWGCTGTAIGGTSFEINTGSANTNAIVAGCTTAGIAAKICYDLTLNTYTDWYLPSLFELNLMYANLHTQSLGSFTDTYYWSSSEASGEYSAYESDYAGTQYFSDGTPYLNVKDNTYYVRAVRAF